MEKSTIGVTIVIAIVALLGAILVDVIADQTLDNTQVMTATETFDLTSGARNATSWINQSYYYHLSHGCAGSDWRTDYSECGITVLNVTNGTKTWNSSDYNVTEFATDCTSVIAGDLNIPTTTRMNASGVNVTTIVYTYCPDNYITSSWGRTVSNMVPGFYALGILVATAFVIYFVLRREGIDI